MTSIVKFHDKELVDITDINAVSSLLQTTIADFFKNLYCSGFKSVTELSVTPSTPVGGGVLLKAGKWLHNGYLIEISDDQTVNIISGTGDWGTPLASDPSNPRIDIVCMKYTTVEGEAQTKWFIDDTVSPPTEYEQSVNTRITNYYDISVVHGTAAEIPVAPETPSGYIKLCEIEVGTGITSIIADNITLEDITLVQNVEELNTALENFAVAVESETEPTENLKSGLLWYKPSTEQTKAYFDSAFRNISGGIVTFTTNRVTLESETNTVTIGIEGFDRTRDVLIAHQNGVYIKPIDDYTVTDEDTTITKKTGTWEIGTELDFIVIMTANVDTEDKLAVACLSSSFTATSDETTHCLINQPNFNYLTDILEVSYDNMVLYETDNYTLNEDKVSIDLVGFSLSTDKKIEYKVWKNIRNTLEGETVDGSLIDDGTVANSKLVTDAKVGSLATLSTTNKSSAVDAINELVSAVGDRSNYTEENYISNDEAVATSLDVLDQQVKDNADSIGTNSTNIGDLTYTEQNYVTNSETLTESVDALDQQMKDNADSISTHEAETASQTELGHVKVDNDSIKIADGIISAQKPNNYGRYQSSFGWDGAEYSNTELSSGNPVLSTGETSGTVTKTIIPSDLEAWGNLKWTEEIPENTSVVCDVIETSIPIMTSNTTPSGEVIYSGDLGTSMRPYMAFDENVDTCWYATNMEAPWYIGYKLPIKGTIKSLKLRAANQSNQNNGMVNAWKLQGSNDGTTWTDLFTQSSEAAWSLGEERTYDLSGNTQSFYQYRVYITSTINASYKPYVGEVKFIFVTIKSNVTSIADLSDIDKTQYSSIKTRWTLSRNSVSDDSPTVSLPSWTWMGKNVYDVWEKIADVTLDEDTAQVDFEALDLDTFAFLELIFLCKSSSTNANLLMRFNDDAGATNYSNQYTKSTGTTISAIQAANTSAIQITDALVDSSDHGFTYGRLSMANILADKYKEVYGKYNSDYGNNPVAYEIASVWKGRTSLITKISIIASSGSIATGSIFILLGVKK